MCKVAVLLLEYNISVLFTPLGSGLMYDVKVSVHPDKNKSRRLLIIEIDFGKQRCYC